MMWSSVPSKSPVLLITPEVMSIPDPALYNEEGSATSQVPVTPLKIKIFPADAPAEFTG